MSGTGKEAIFPVYAWKKFQVEEELGFPYLNELTRDKTYNRRHEEYHQSYVTSGQHDNFQGCLLHFQGEIKLQLDILEHLAFRQAVQNSENWSPNILYQIRTVCCKGSEKVLF